MIAWFARNHVAANLLLVTVVALGSWSMWFETPLEVFPSVERDRIDIGVSFPGATPEEVEEQVAVPIERAIRDVIGIEEVRTRTREGWTNISLDIASFEDLQRVKDNVESRVDAITTFPEDVGEPSINQAAYRREVISAVISGDVSEQELRQLAERVRDDLLELPEVTQVDLEAARDREIAIEVSEQRLREHGLTLRQVADGIRAGSINVSAGNLRSSSGDLLLLGNRKICRTLNN